MAVNLPNLFRMAARGQSTWMWVLVSVVIVVSAASLWYGLASRAVLHVDG